jgi:hypothetical protein
MVDGAFIGFRANFNVNFEAGCEQGVQVIPKSSINSPSTGSGGCTLNNADKAPARRLDLLLMLVFMAWLGLRWRHSTARH